MSKKLITLAVAVLSLAAFFIHQRTQESQKAVEEQLKEALLAKDVYHAQQLLVALEKKPTDKPLALYNGYLCCIKGEYALASKYFQKAHGAATTLDTQIEIAKAEMFLNYITARDTDLFAILENTRKIAADHPALTFHEGLYAYLKSDYKKALKHWDSPKTYECIAYSPFSTVWLDIHRAHALITEKEFGKAREILERELHFGGTDNRDLHNLATHFLGLSYLEEAKNVPAEERESFYKISRFYMGKGLLSDGLQREKRILVASVKEEVKQLLYAGDSSARVLSFIHLLQEWKADAPLEEIGSFLADLLVKAPEESQEALCKQVGNEFSKDPFLGILTQQLLTHLSDELKKGSIGQLASLWQCLEVLTNSSPKLKTELANLTSAEILRTLPKDSDALPKTRAFLAFWKQVVKAEAERKELAALLYTQAELLWQQEGCEKKGTKLIDLCFEIVTEKERLEMQKRLEHFLTALYIQAEESNMVRRLSLIYDACTHFKMGAKAFHSQAKVDNYLADADYLFSARNYPGAQTHAEWVLKLDPKNQDALRLFGLSSYYLGEYRRAVAALRRVVEPDVDAEKALVLSRALFAQDQEKHLAQIDSIDLFEED